MTLHGVNCAAKCVLCKQAEEQTPLVQPVPLSESGHVGGAVKGNMKLTTCQCIIPPAEARRPSEAFYPCLVDWWTAHSVGRRVMVPLAKAPCCNAGGTKTP